MLDDVGGVNLVEHVLFERVWERIQVVNDVHVRQRRAINADGPIHFVVAAANIQYFHSLLFSPHWSEIRRLQLAGKGGRRGLMRSGGNRALTPQTTRWDRGDKDRARPRGKASGRLRIRAVA